MMTSTRNVTLLTVLAFGVHFVIDEVYFQDLRGALNEVIGSLGISHILAYVLVGLPLLVGTLLLGNKPQPFLENLGLGGSLGKALAFALVCTLPMFLGFSFLFDFRAGLTLNRFLIAVLAAAFFEELYFRGFLFGQLFRHTSFGFVASVLPGALLFGGIHLYQSNNLLASAGIFLVTFLGAVLFCWAYVEWRYNLWVPIGLHLLMNLSWDLFQVSENALGGAFPNVFRALTIGLVIGLTILYKKRRGIPMEINSKTLWRKKEPQSRKG